MLISARSIGLRAASALRPGITGRMLASFERVCDLVADSGAVVALVWDEVGDGPLNVVLARKPGAALPAGARFAVTRKGESLRSEPSADEGVSSAAPILLALDGPEEPRGTLRDASPLLIDLSSAVPWNPRPAWEALWPRREQIAAGALVIRDKLATALARHVTALDGVLRVSQAVAEAYRAGDRGALTATITALCGLGPGLTPAGDDWLAGWLLGRYLERDLRGLRDLEGLIVDVAADRTTTLSRAFLECAAAGEADADWHVLLNALARGAAYERISASADTILAHGDTSGVAMLAGFLAGIGIPIWRDIP